MTFFLVHFEHPSYIFRFLHPPSLQHALQLLAGKKRETAVSAHVAEAKMASILDGGQSTFVAGKLNVLNRILIDLDEISLIRSRKLFYLDLERGRQFPNTLRENLKIF